MSGKEMISIAAAPESITTAGGGREEEAEGGEASDRNNKAITLFSESRRYFACTVLAFTLLVFTVLGVGIAAASFVTSNSLASGTSGKLGSFVPNSIGTVNAYEVVTMPDSNTNCHSYYDTITNFCVVRWGCKDEPWSPGGRCGLFKPTVNEEALQLMCSSPSNQKRIIGSSGVFTRRIATYKLNITSATDTRFPLKKPYDCEYFWPVLLQVINEKTPSTRWIQDGFNQYAIRGVVEQDPDVWFNMCGFCSFASQIRM